MLENRLNGPWQALRVCFGGVAVIAGMDKFSNLLTDWTLYVSPMLDHLLPISASMFMQLVGLIEIVVGLLILTVFTRVGAYILSAWLAVIAINLVTTGRFFDIAVRDLVMAVGAFTLARLTEVRERTHKPRLVMTTTSSARDNESKDPYPVFQRTERDPSRSSITNPSGRH